MDPIPDGLRLNLVAILPAHSSPASQQVREALEPQVSLEHSIYRESFHEPASSYIIKSAESGSRTIVNYSELPEMTVDEFEGIAGSLVADGCWFHFEVGVNRFPCCFSCTLPLYLARAEYRMSLSNA